MNYYSKMITNKRIIKTLEWIIAEAIWRFDQAENNINEGSQGGYGPKLKEAIELLEELKKQE